MATSALRLSIPQVAPRGNECLSVNDRPSLSTPSLFRPRYKRAVRKFQQNHVRSLPIRRRGQRLERCIAAAGQETDNFLREAAQKMVDYFVRSGTAVGLGTGRGSCMAIEYLGEKLRAGVLNSVVGVPTSSLSAAEAAKAGIPLTTLGASPKLAFAFTDADAAQEGTLYSIIGRRGLPGRDAIPRERAVGRAAEQRVLLLEERGFVAALEGALPVHIKREDWLETAEEIDDLFLGDAEVWRRPSSGDAGPMGGDNPLVTEDGHFVLDILFTSPIRDPVEVAQLLDSIPGVADHGLLLEYAYAAAVGGRDGVKIRTSLFKEAFNTKD